MDQERERIQEDLRGLIRGDVRCDDLTVQLYATDASVHEVRPRGVVYPRNLEDVVVCVQYAAENGIPLHARGAGSGSAGQALGSGLVLDFSTYMRRLVRLGTDTVRVQPGIVCAELNRHLHGKGRCLGSDPTNADVTTIGGMIGVDAAGSHRLRYGSTRDWVESLQIVLADGHVMEVAVHDVPATAASGIEGDRRQRLVQQVAQVVRNNESLIASHWPRTSTTCAGYRVNDVLRDNRLHLARLLTGSEGTLALVTEATLRCVPCPAAVSAALLFFERLEAAARGALVVAELGAAACDLLDRRLVSIARELDVRYDTLIPQRAEAVLLIEFHGENRAEVWSQAQAAITRVQRHARLAFDSQIATDEEDVAIFWGLAHRALDGLHVVPGMQRPQPFVDDIALPLDRLPQALVEIQNLLKQYAITSSFYAHAGQGQLHLKPFLDLSDPKDVAKMKPLATALYDLTCQYGGTISGEHGDGLSRSWYLRRQFGPAYRVFRQIKDVFDPDAILNPGKIVAPPAAQATDNLRSVSPLPGLELVQRDTGHRLEPTQTAVDLQLVWQQPPILETAVACNGCAQCRSQMGTVRMCPIFRYAPREQAAPRAKANLLRAVLTGRLDAATLGADTVKALADLCVHCHQCRLECPAEVDIPKLMTECKAQYVATNGLRPREWLVARIDRLSQWGSLLHRPANWALQNRTLRWLAERTLGIAQGRKLPRFAPRSFLRLAHRRRLTRPRAEDARKVLFFVDVYANWHDVELADALLEILRHHRVAVYAPTRQKQSGMAAVAIGATDIARRLAHHNLPLLADAVRQGYDIVTTEPAAALCLKREYPNLTDEEDAHLVAEHTYEACSYLWHMHQAGELRLEFQPLPWHVGYHQPCHVRALEVGMPGYDLLCLIPELKVQLLDAGCSGMAGTFGLMHRNYRSSLRAGWNLIATLRDASIQLGATECTSCKMQMEQGTSKPTVHPLKLLALAYGLMPQLESTLTTPGRELVIT